MLNPEIKKFRLAVCARHPEDGCSMMRVLGPLGAMMKEDARLEVSLPPRDAAGGQECDWPWLIQCDALFIRPTHPIHAAVIAKAQFLGLSVWADFDDDLTTVMDSNPHIVHYPQPATNDYVQAALDMAEVVTVTTEKLREEWSLEFGIQNPDKVRVLPNACDWKFTETTPQRRVVWRGGHSHDEDLESVLPVMGELARLPQFALWDWVFLGQPTWKVKRHLPMERVKFGAGGLLEWREVLASAGGWVMVVPLVNTRFNHCKSNLAWLEASAAGMPVLAPDWPEWQKPGITNYTGTQDFAAKLRELMQGYGNDGMKVRAKVDASREYIRANLMLRDVNQQRWAILNELWEKRNAEYAVINHGDTEKLKAQTALLKKNTDAFEKKLKAELIKA